jgi:hypothetical protein
MADAADSKSVVRKDVEVQVLSPAPVMDPCRLATGGTTARRSRIIVPTFGPGHQSCSARPRSAIHSFRICAGRSPAA